MRVKGREGEFLFSSENINRAEKCYAYGFAALLLNDVLINT